MAYIDYKENENSISIFKGIYNSNHDIKLHKRDNFYSEIYDENGEFKGLKLNDFLSNLELKGYKAEVLFKDLLENNEIPFPEFDS